MTTPRLTVRMIHVLQAAATQPRTEAELLAVSGGDRPMRTIAALRRNGTLLRLPDGTYTVSDKGARALWVVVTPDGPPDQRTNDAIDKAVTLPPVAATAAAGDVAVAREKPQARKIPGTGLYDVEADKCLCDYAQGPCYFHDRGQAARSESR